ncbi:MAG: hypothetical protein GXO34_00620 [Deltaproteobacteria bacterium]|nr:hypothetical protein [Deltaproteobacteria bacterium]
MEKIFNPDSLVVIGVSEHPDNLARNIVINLVDFGWPGELYLLGRKGGECCGYPILTDYAELPENLDLAVILTPAATVPQVMHRCIERGIRRMVIESGGFSELSEEGRRLEEEIARIAAENGVRFVGPNGISIVNRHNGLCLPFMPLAPDEVLPGALSVISQSGGLALTYIGCGRAERVGVAKVISMGNKTNLDEIDYLNFLAVDPETEVIGLYLESIAKGQDFLAAVRDCPKPVILHKANTSEQSREIAKSHTAALAVDDEVVEAACRRVGICRVNSFADFINAAKAFALPPLKGDRLMVLSRSGGHAVVTADAAGAAGFQLPPLGAEFAALIAEHFRAAVIRLNNPLDLGDIFDIDFYVTILERSLQREDIDGVVFNHVFQTRTELEATRRLVGRIEELSCKYDKPVALTLFASREAIGKVMAGSSFPVFSEPLLAVEALARSRARASYLLGCELPAPALPGIAVVDSASRNLFNEWLAAAASREDRTLFIDQALQIMSEYGLPTAPFALARHPHEVLELGNEFGCPLVLKVVAEGLSHKSDVGGVLTGIKDLRILEDVYPMLFERFSENPGFCGVLVQKEVENSIEMITGARRDESFGEVFLLGLGGIYAEIFKDVRLEPGPLDRKVVDEMVACLRGRKILAGARGRAGIDLAVVYRIMSGLQALLNDFPAISEVEINPLVFDANGRGVIVDARIIAGNMD